MTVRIREVGTMFAALIVTGLYWAYGAGLTLFSLSQVAKSFLWLDLFRPLFYIPGVIAVIYLYFFKKKRGLFSESLAFLLTLSLVMFWTLELIIFI
jgi:hypothetical protein